MTTSESPRRVGSFTSESWEARTSMPLLVAAFAFLAVLTIPVIDTQLDSSSRALLSVLNVGIWFVFAADYLIRLWLAPARWSFVRRHLPDLAMVALPALRPLRILKLLSIGNRLARGSANTALADTGKAVAASAVLLVYLGAVGVLDSERHDPQANIRGFGDAVWWACTTITGVGYGDHYPVSAQGRAIAVALMVIGITLLGLLTAGIAAWFVRQSTDAAVRQSAALLLEEVHELGEEELEGQRRLEDELDEVLAAMAALDSRLREIQAKAAAR